MEQASTSNATGRQTRKPKTGQECSAITPADTAAPLSIATKVHSKTGKVLALLKREEGTTLDEMVEATGWLPHTTRAALTGLKKKGYVIERSKRGEASCYHIRANA